jgi:polysaccharide pyruvyl transferase WcaK-like protein
MMETVAMPRDTAGGISSGSSYVSFFRISDSVRRSFGRRAEKDGFANVVPVARTIGIMDHMGAGNLGDDTTQTAVIANIKQRWPDAVIVGFTMNPSDTEARHGIRSYPLRRRTWDRPGEAMGERSPIEQDKRSTMWRLFAAMASIARKPKTLLSELRFLGRSFAAVRRVDVFILSGSGQLLDSWGGPWEYPFTIYKWVALARLAGAKCYFLNVGAGPLQHKLSRFFIRHALRLANYVSFRDEPSRALAREVGFSGKACVSHDSVYSFDSLPSSVRQVTTSDVPIVGLAPMAYCDPRRYCVQDSAAYTDLIRKFSAFGSWLSRGHRLEIFSTDIWFDADTLNDLSSGLEHEPGVVAARILPRKPIGSIQTLLPAMATMDYIVTCRFHGVIFAHLLNIPVIAISHHSKVATLMADLGLSEYCLDIDSFDLDLLKTKFDRMVADREQIKARLAETAVQYRTELIRQFDEIFPPGTGR